MEKAKGQELTMTRIYDEPREFVFKAWIDPELLAQWWGPEGFVSEVAVNARPGGQLRMDMRGPDGSIYPNRGVFHEVVEPEKLEFTTGFWDEAGNIQMEERTTVTFEEYNGKTKLTVHTVVVRCSPGLSEMLKGLETGWRQSLDRLARLARPSA
jgi:uncharacterized protein YndB with AHSA1/START domain